MWDITARLLCVSEGNVLMKCYVGALLHSPRPSMCEHTLVCMYLYMRLWEKVVVVVLFLSFQILILTSMFSMLGYRQCFVFFLLYYMLKKIKKLVIAGDQWFWLWFLHITSYQEKQPDMAIRPYESRATSSFQRIPDDHTKSLFWKMLAKRFLKVEGFSTCGKQESSTLNMKIEGQILWFTSAYLCIETEERFSQEAKEWKKNIVFWREGAKK